MKYIMLEAPDGQKLPVIFPDCLVHAHVAGAMQMVVDTLDPRKDLRPKQLDAMLERGSAKVTGAGFVGFDIVSTSGKSESLGGVKSSAVDAARIMMGDSVSRMPDAMVAMLALKWLKNKIDEGD